jgi:carboxyl-terminal processing protease
MTIHKIMVSKISLAILSVILLAGVFGGGFYLGQGKSPAVNRHLLAYAPEADVTATSTATSKLNFDLYWEVWDNLKTNYVDKNKVDDQALFYGSLKGMAAAAGDPYTIFMDPKEAKDFSNDLAGTFEGIGAEVGMRNDVVTVISPLDDMPAQKAGIRAGDKIYAVDSKPTMGLTVDEVVKKIRGPKNTSVTLTIIRGKDKPRDIKITRSLITVKSVKAEIRPDGIMVIRVSHFNDDTAALFNDAVALALEKQPKGIILDLRNNPGGYLETAVSMASEWLESGTVVSEQFGDGHMNSYTASGQARLKDFKTIVLINGGSASASEILAGALRDTQKATIIGETSYGKGSVQNVRELSDGSSLKITVAKWLTPNGDCINETGIKPTIEVKLSATDADKNLDPQFTKALDLLKAKK